MAGENHLDEGPTSGRSAVNAFSEAYGLAPNKGKEKSTSPVNDIGSPGGRPVGSAVTAAYAEKPDGVDKLAASFHLAKNIDPELARKVFTLKNRTGFSEEFLMNNADSVEKSLKAYDVDPARFRTVNPKLASWIENSPSNAAAIKNDYFAMSYVERQFKDMAASWERGWDVVDRGELGIKGMRGELTTEDRKSLAEINKRMSLEKDFGIDGFFEEVPSAMAEQAPLWYSMSKSGLKTAIPTALGGGLTGAGIALGAGQMGPQVAVPEEVVTVPGAFVWGAKAAGSAGFMLGAGVEAAKMEAGNSYLDLEAIKDEKGRPLPREVAVGGAWVVGVINGSLEFVPFDNLIKKLPGIRNLGKEGIKKALQNPSTRRLLMTTFGAIGSQMAMEGSTEFLQEMVSDTTEELAKIAHEEAEVPLGSVLHRLFNQEKIEAWGQAARKGMQAGGGTSAAIQAVTLPGDVKKVLKAKRTKEAWNNIGEGIVNSELHEKLPDQTSSIVEHLVKDSDQENVHVPVEAWNEYWQSKGVDPVEIAEAVTGSEKAHAEASETGVDLVIKTKDYAAKLAATEHNQFFQNEIRATPEDMNAREANEYIQNMDSESKAQHDEEADKVHGNVVNDLLEIGTPIEEAQASADLLSEMLRGMSPKAGLSPMQVYDRIRPQFRREGVNLDKSEVPGASSFSQDLFGQTKNNETEQTTVKFLDNLEVTRAAESHKSIDASKGRKELSKIAMDLTPRGTFKNAHTGEMISISSKTVKKSVSHGIQKIKGKSSAAFKNHLEVLQYLPSLIERANYTNDSVERKGNPRQGWKILFAPLNMNGKDQWINMKVYVDEQGRHVLHNYTLADAPRGRSENLSANRGRRSNPKSVTNPDKVEPDSTSELNASPFADSVPLGQFTSEVKHLRETVEYFQIEKTPRKGMGPNKLGYYSLLKAEIQNMDFKQIPAKDLRGRIKNIQGIKPEELEWTGVIEWLDNQEDKVSKEEVMNYLKENGVQVEQVVQGSKAGETEISWGEEEYLSLYDISGGGDLFYDSGEYDHYADEMDEEGSYSHEILQEKKNELRKDYTDDEGKVDEETLDSVARERAMEKLNDKFSESVESGESYYSEIQIEADDYPLQITGRPEGGDYWNISGYSHLHNISEGVEGSLEEAKIQAIRLLHESGELDRELRKIFKDEIVWTSYLPTLRTLPSDEEIQGYYEKHRKAIDEENDWWINEYADTPEQSEEQRIHKGLTEAKMMLESDLRETDPWTEFQTGTEENLYFRLLIKGSKAEGYGLAVLDDDSLDTELKAKDLESAKREALEYMTKKGYVSDVPLSPEGDEASINAPTESASFGNYTLKGGTNYREILLTLPRMADKGSEFTRSHWRPKNVVAHIRTKDRESKDGKRILFVEEIQSDWHQKGRDEGYVGDKPLPRPKILTKDDLTVSETSTQYIVKTNDDSKTTTVGKKVVYSKEEAIEYGLKMFNEEIRDEISEVESEESSRVPRAPFKNSESWLMLSFKRVLSMAAQDGYDQIMWTPGQVHADRYNMSNHVDEVLYRKLENDSYEIVVSDLHGHKVNLPQPSFTSKEMPGVFGKEISEQIINDQGRTDVDFPNSSRQGYEGFSVIESVDLNFGGEGFKHFYDKMMPKALSKHLKKLDKSVKIQVVDTKKTLGERLTNNNGGGTYKKAWAIEITDNMKDSILKGQTLFQDEAEGKRARFRVLPDRQMVIDLFKKANKSSLPHELGHMFLEVYQDLAESTNATPELKGDLQKLYRHLGVISREEIGVDHHEAFVDSFMTWLKEGNAPTPALRRAFQKFRAWLTVLYSQVRNLDVELDDEIREVFARMFVANEDVTAAQKEHHQNDVFLDLRELGLNPRDAQKYAGQIDEAKQEALDKLTSKHMDQVEREKAKWWKEESTNLREEIEEDVNSDKVYIALALLQGGTLPDGSPLPEGMKPIKLDRAGLVEEFGKDFLKGLPKPHIYAKDGGAHHNAVAAMLGFDSGKDMIDAMGAAENREEKITRLVEEEMKRKHGDLLTDGTAKEEAEKAIHNDKRALLLRKQIEILASQKFATFKGLTKKITRKMPSNDLIKDQARTMIGAKKIRDIRPSSYKRAEIKAGNEAVDAFLKGDFEAAVDAKHRELFNHELYRAAVEAQEQVEKTLKYFAKFNRKTIRKALARAGEDYLPQIDGILERFDLRKGQSLKAIDKRKSLAEWVKGQEEQGITPNVPDHLLYESNRKHYKDTSYADLMGVRDAVKNIEHLGKLKTKLLANKYMKEKEAVVSEILGSIAAHHKIKDPDIVFAPSFAQRVGRFVKGVHAEHLKPEFIFRFLDGEKDMGAAWRHLFQPLVDAENDENSMMRNVAINMDRIFGEYTKVERAKWSIERIDIPEIKKKMTKMNVFMVALNWGNLYNRQALMEGYGWSEQQVVAILGHLDERDWQTVTEIWKYIDSFWPLAKKLEEDINGLAPEKVEAAPFETKYGEMPGGYFPVVFDGTLSYRQSQLDVDGNIQDAFGRAGTARAMTKHGHLKSRTNTGGKPLKLEMSVIANHLSEVIHDITHRRAVIDVAKIVEDKRIREAMEGTVGREIHRTLKPWLMNIAGERRSEPISKIERILSKARSGATVVNMGLKMTTALVQFSGYTVSTKELGSVYATIGLKDVYSNPLGILRTHKWVTERSAMMRDRLTSYDRDVRDALKRLNVAGTKAGYLGALESMTPDMQSAFFYHIGLMDMAVSLPTWMGAYKKAMDGKAENVKAGNEADAIAYADKLVRLSQGAGGPKDLAQIQQHGPAIKLFTMFYSYFSVLYNQYTSVHSEFKQTKDVGKLLASLTMIWFLPPIIEDLMLGRGPDDDADEEEWANWLIKKEVTYPFQTVILLRDIVNGMDRWGYSPSPAFDALESIGGAGVMLGELTLGDKDEIERKDIKKLFMTTGYFAGLPSRQAWLTSEYLFDWMTGEEQPEDPMEGLWRGFVKGKPRD